jgi:hypothetical protein
MIGPAARDYNFLYGSVPAEFKSSFSVAESVERLSAVSKRSASSAVGKETAVRRVALEHASLQRAIPMVNNSF